MAELESVEREGEDIVLYGVDNRGENYSVRQSKERFTMLMRGSVNHKEDAWDRLEATFAFFADLEDDDREQDVQGVDPDMLNAKSRPGMVGTLSDDVLRQQWDHVRHAAYVFTEWDVHEIGELHDILLVDAYGTLQDEMMRRGLMT